MMKRANFRCSYTKNGVNMGLQVFAGYGYSREYPLEKLLRDARIYSIFEGTNQVQRQVIGKTLLG